MAVRVVVSPLLISFALAVAACGGRIAGDPSGGGTESSKSPTPSDPASKSSTSPSDTASSGSGSGGDPFPICPEYKPKIGQACASVGQGCAYFNYDTGACVSFRCDASGWQSSTPAGC